MEQTRRFTVALGRNAVEYAELIIALGIAAYFAYRSAAGDVTVQTLVQATGGILAVLAIAMVRERHERVAVALEVREAARSISGPSKPWRVLDAKFTWKLHDERGEQAMGFTRKEIRIEHDDVYSLYEWSTPPPQGGEITRHVCRARLPGSQADQQLRILTEDLHGPGGRTYRIISLDGVHNRGERLAYTSERALKGFFTQSRESVSINVEIPTDQLSLEILWPERRPPKNVWFERTGKPAATVPVAKLGRTSGRRRFRDTLTDPRPGERITVSWTW